MNNNNKPLYKTLMWLQKRSDEMKTSNEITSANHQTSQAHFAFKYYLESHSDEPNSSTSINSSWTVKNQSKKRICKTTEWQPWYTIRHYNLCMVSSLPLSMVTPLLMLCTLANLNISTFHTMTTDTSDSRCNTYFCHLGQHTACNKN